MTEALGTAEKKLRKDIRSIYDAGLQAADPTEAMMRALAWDTATETMVIRGASYDLKQFNRVYVVGIGKASCPMAAVIENLLGSRINDGIVITKYGHRMPLRHARVYEAAHPIPDEKGLEAAQSVLSLARDIDGDDIVFFLVSGGGSSLMPVPATGISLQEKSITTDVLLRCGATIHEINAIRKHLSGIKGGQLARTVYPGTIVSLVMSDVIGDDLDIIASGPAVADGSTFNDCGRILDKYHIHEEVPKRVLERIVSGMRGAIPETPKPGDESLTKSTSYIVSGSYRSLAAARDKAEQLGYRTMILSSFIEGETKEIAKVHGAIIREVRVHGNPIQTPACIISGGETTVTVRGRGMGGRNTEFALSAAIEISGLPGVAVLSGATDGTDGPTDAAGAIADGETVPRASMLGIDADVCLSKNDSYNFFRKLDDLIITGPTLTNVMDLRILLIGE